MARRQSLGQSGQVLVIVAVWLVALIGSAALILLTGSVEWQRNQMQQLADQSALDAALKIGVGCSAASPNTVIDEADSFLATQRTRLSSYPVAVAGTCAGGLSGTGSFSGGITATYHYPYRGHQQQVEVILTLALPISFGNYLGASTTNVTRRAVAQQLNGSTAAVSATTLSCTGGQFNVGGSIATSNAISLSGTCAVYAHSRFDAASSTYSDLGNASVYNAQTWVGGGGACVAGANSGSSNAVCADGYERAGHTTVSCGTTGTSAFLAAGEAAINPNPCAAGTGPQPVAPLATALPPEPNADPAAIATLPGGAACTAAGVYPNLVIGGATVGTARAGTPAPVKDASGFWHFKPSCYGYLDFTSMRSGIASRQLGVELRGARHLITPTLPAVSQAGTLLVTTLTADPNWKSTAAPAGWVLAAGTLEAASARVEIWYYPNNPGGIVNGTWTVLPAASNVAAQMTEWTGVATVAPLDQTGALNIGVATTTAINVTAGATAQANELVITNEGYQVAAGAFTAGPGWNALVNDPPNDMSSEYRTNLGIGIPSETVSTSVATTWALAMATFRPSPSAAGGAVLDPGFYHFNGSGFPGGGGICLNSAQLLARDVTLEFVNQAGFSTGTCLAGGGVSCAGSCQFGSTPCSISACPPNSTADSAGGGYTWFAAPCSQAPAGDAAACAGSAWCPAGDRACWNLLVWAPASNTGQIAIKGTSAKHWLLGSLFWPGTCTDAVNANSMIDGTIFCGALTVSASAGAGVAVGSDYGINTALVEAVLLE